MENVIGQNIRKFRTAKGFTQAQLGDMCGVGEKYLSSFERGARTPGKRSLEKLCTALGVDEKTLRYGEESGSVKPVHSKDRRHTPDYIRLAYSEIEKKLEGKSMADQLAVLSRVLKAVENDCEPPFPKAA